MAELVGCLRLVGRGKWNEQSVVDLGVGDGDADAVGGEGVVVGVCEPMDEAGQAQAAQLDAAGRSVRPGAGASHSSTLFVVFVGVQVAA